MTRSALIRYSAFSALLGGLASILEFIIYPANAALAQVFLLLAYVLTAAGPLGFHLLHRGRDGRLGRAGVVTASVGSLLSSLAMIVTLATTGDADLVHTLGALLLIVGYLVYGLSILQVGIVSPWYAAAFILIGPATFIFLGFGGSTTLVFGAFWMILGFALLLQGRSSSWERKPSPIR